MMRAIGSSRRESVIRPVEPASDDTKAPRSGHGRVRRTLSGWRALGRIAYRDPEHVAERLALYGARNLGEPSLEWAHGVRETRPDVPRAVIAEELRTQTARVARIDGAVSGTPFLIALIPGYLAYLREEGRMVLRTAALYGRDPRELETSAEMLALRGVHPTVDAARAALEQVRDVPLPEKPVKRRSVRTWVHSVYRAADLRRVPLGPLRRARGDRAPLAEGLLRVRDRRGGLGDHLGATRHVDGRDGLGLRDPRPSTRATSAAVLRRRRRQRAGGDRRRQATQDRGHRKREILRATILVLSVAVPIGFVAYADHVRQSTGINWLGALGALVALSLVITASVLANRR